MDIKNIGSVSVFIKNMKLEGEWNIKKNSGGLQPESKKNELQQKNEQFKASYKKQQEESPSDQTLTAINNKVAVGADLSPEEMRYLQSKNPTLYQKLKNLENEKKSYERELKRCKTKEEAKRLKTSRVSASLSAINSVKSNPNIPESTKLGVAQGEMKRLSELEKVELKFIKIGGYNKLPTEQELHKAQKDMELAKEAKTEKAPDNENFAVDDPNAKNTNNSSTKGTDAVKINDDCPTEAEAELTPEAQKVKRSKAKSAYDEAKKLEPQAAYIGNAPVSLYKIDSIK
ncbi:MAG: hypothetical protein ACI4JB_01805 [Porcipelethomonas sp.]